MNQCCLTICRFYAEGSKETSNPQQAHKRRLFVHVSALIHRCNCSSDCGGLGSHQVLVVGGGRQECYSAIFKRLEFLLVFASEALFVELHSVPEKASIILGTFCAMSYSSKLIILMCFTRLACTSEK